MKELNPRPKKNLGQNFLIDNNLCNKIIQACQLRKTDIVVEIGSGRGALTGKLAQKTKQVIAIELDRDLYEILNKYLSEYKNLKILCLDFLKFDLSNLGEKRKIIGNLPFYITTPIISHIIRQSQFVDFAFITVQKEIAQRIIANPGNKQYGAFSCFVQFYTEPKILFEIKKTCFWPRPEVDAAFMQLKIRQEPYIKVKDEKLFFNIIRSAFNQRRKNILNSLKKIIPKDKLQKVLDGLNINYNIRPEDLSLEDFSRISNLIGRDKN